MSGELESIAGDIANTLSKADFSGERPVYEKHPDDGWCDEVRIITVPRYKTSGLSGDEWRFSYRIELLRKGLVLYQRSTGTMEAATMALPWFLLIAGEGDEFKVPDYDEKLKQLETRCANPGCHAEAVSVYRFKKLACSRCGESREPKWGEHRIRFCQKHLRRGDCGLHDADDNYEVVSGPGPDEAKGYGDDISESAFGGTINIG